MPLLACCVGIDNYINNIFYIYFLQKPPSIDNRGTLFVVDYGHSVQYCVRYCVHSVHNDRTQVNASVHNPHTHKADFKNKKTPI